MQTSVLLTTEDGFSKLEKDEWFSETEYQSFLGGSLSHEHSLIYPSDLSNSINDKIVTLSFKAAIEINFTLFENKTVIDLNSGIGLYSLFAAQQGAKKVYSIEPNEMMASYAKKIVKDNQYSDIITVICNDIYSVTIPSKVDIIICQWMGYFLLQQSLLHQLIYARQKYLDNDGYIFPDKATIYLSCVEDMKYKFEKLESWDNVYGINMDCIKAESLSNPLVESFDNKQIIGTIYPIYTIDLYTIDYLGLNFSHSYEIEFLKNEYASALVAWFDVEFNKVPNQIKFTTCPFNQATKWKQTLFYLKNDIRGKKGDIIKGSFCCRKNDQLENTNGLDIKISYHFPLKDYQNEVNDIVMYKMK